MDDDRGARRRRVCRNNQSNVCVEMTKENLLIPTDG